MDDHNTFCRLSDRYMPPSDTTSSRSDDEIVPNEDRHLFDYDHPNSLDLSDNLFKRTIVLVGGKPVALLLAFGMVAIPLAVIGGQPVALAGIVIVGIKFLTTTT